MRSLHGLSPALVEGMKPGDVASVGDYGFELGGDPQREKVLAPWCDGDFRLMYLNGQVAA